MIQIRKEKEEKIRKVIKGDGQKVGDKKEKMKDQRKRKTKVTERK